jgi:hypothetical protein
METELRCADAWFRYPAIDIRSFDSGPLLESPHVGDNVIAILARLRDQRDAVRRIIVRIAKLPPWGQGTVLSQLLILAGLRRLSGIVEEEARKMPIHIDILENEVLGREYKRGLQEGELRGEQRGELTIFRCLLEKRFGPIPDWADERLGKLTTRELEDRSLLLLDAGSLEELLQQRVAFYSTASSTQPGSVAGLLLRKTIFRVFGNGRFVASARL